MDNLKATAAVNDLVNKALSDRENELSEINMKISSEAKTIAGAIKAMEAATLAADEKAYIKAKTERWNAEAAKEMYEARRERLNTQPLISAADYEKAANDIFAEIAALDEQTKERLADLSEQMEAESHALGTAIAEANRVLQRLQHDVYRDADRHRNQKTGEILYIPSEEKKIPNGPCGTVCWGQAAVSYYQYEAVRGNKRAKEGKTWGRA